MYIYIYMDVCMHTWIQVCMCIFNFIDICICGNWVGIRRIGIQRNRADGGDSRADGVGVGW